MTMMPSKKEKKFGKIFKKQNFNHLGYNVKEAYVLSNKVKPTKGLIESLIHRNTKLWYKNFDKVQAKYLDEYLKQLKIFRMRNVYPSENIIEINVINRGFII